MDSGLINFISNLPPHLRSGGFSAANAAAFEIIKTAGSVHYVGPIDPPVILPEKVLSKSLRLAGFRGDFFFYSPRRLKSIADEVRSQCIDFAQIDYFHGFTPWILTKPARPYIAWSDCTFRDYIDIYHEREQFGKEGLARIEHREATWLKNARRILFTSEWAAGRAVRYYALDKSKVYSVGIFGEVQMPTVDRYAGGREFVFVSTNFKAKGGEIVLSAFRKLRKHCADASLIIVGDQPPNATAEPGVSYTGFLRKEVASEYNKFQQIIAQACALVHPTSSDITPSSLVEAGYFGCPIIASRRFAIPELVDHARSGILLDDPSNAASVTEAMIWMLSDEARYHDMRRAIWEKARAQSSRDGYQKRLLSHVRELCDGRK
jgi:glycosyltransferase involved in cell wall biosynthesis